MKVSTRLTRARRSQAALALDPIPASKVQADPIQIAELDKHNLLRSFALDSICSIRVNQASAARCFRNALKR